MIPYGHQSISKKDIQRVSTVLRSDWLTQGPEVSRFEEALARYTGAKYAVAVANGTVALHAAYLAAGIKSGDEVITTANTFVGTANMLVAIGAKPVFCDIRSDTCNIDETKIEELITKKTKAIVPVHIFGHPCEMDAIYRIAKKYHLVVIEDACHALGARYKSKPVGNLKSAATVFSFHPVKAITTGEGGAIVTNDKALYTKMKLLRSHGLVKDKNGFNVMSELGYNYRLNDLQAALGRSQLTRINSFIKSRHSLVKLYNQLLSKEKNIILPIELSHTYSGWHIYVIRTTDSRQRLPLYHFLQKKGVGVNFHYPTVYSHPFYKKLGYTKVACPVADLYHETAITLPLFTHLSRRDVSYVCDLIKEFFAAR